MRGSKRRVKTFTKRKRSKQNRVKSCKRNRSYRRRHIMKGG